MLKICLLSLSLLLLLSMPFPVWATLKVDWDTNLMYNSAAPEDNFSWNTGFQASGDWSLSQNWAFVLRDRVFKESQAEDWTGSLDRGYFQYEKDAYRVQLGRQAVIWGVGWIFRPTDLITSQQSFKQEDTRPGKDLATLYWATSPLTNFNLVAGDHLVAIRPEWRIGETNLRILGMSLPDKTNLVGFDFQGGLANFYGEMGYKWSDQFENGKPLAILGWKKTLKNSDLLFLEYYRNDGASKQNFQTGQNYFGAGMEIPWDELTTFDLGLVYNIDRNEAVFSGLASWQLTDNLDFKASVIIAPDSQTSVLLKSKYYF